MGIQHELPRRQFRQALLDFEWRLSLRQAGAVRNPKYVRVHGDRGFSKSRIQYDIGCFTSDAGECLKFVSRTRNFTSMFVQQQAAGFDDIFRLRIVESDGFDVFLQTVDAEIKNGLRCIGHRVEYFRRLVDTNIGRLSGEYDGDE